MYNLFVLTTNSCKGEFINSWLLRCGTARGSDPWLSLAGPIKVKARKSFLFTYLRQRSAMLFAPKECVNLLGRADSIIQVGSDSLSLCFWY